MSENLIKNLGLVASAGTGKTTSLIVRYVELLSKGENIEEILCITFTNKAAKEMQERIIDMLYSITHFDELMSDKQNKVFDIYNQNFSHLDFETFRKSIAEKYKNAYSNFFNISTMDSFFASILKSFYFFSDANYNFDVFQDEIKEKIKKNVFNALALSLDNHETLKRTLFENEYFFNTYDIEFFLATLFNLRYKKFNFLDFSHACKLLEFKEKLCDVLIKNIDKVSTISRKKLLRFCQEKNPKKFIVEYEDNLPDKETFKNIKDIIVPYWESYRKEVGCYLEQKIYSITQLSYQLYNLIKQFYDEELKKIKGLNFDDITHKVYNLFYSQNFNSDFFYFLLDTKIKHILIDEFQDTNYVQYLIFRPLIEEILSGQGTNEKVGSFFYVGDPKQAIYRFRGSNSELFDKPLEEFGGKIIKDDKTLTKNYRSAQSIVNFINIVFTNLSSKINFPYTSVQSVVRENGFVHVETIEKNKDKNDYLKLIKEWVKKLSESFELNDIAILSRDNDFAKEIAQYLIDSNYSVKTDITSKIFYHKASMVLLSALKFLLYKEDIYIWEAKSYIEVKNLNVVLNKINFANNFDIILEIVKILEFDKYFFDDPNLYKILDIAFEVSLKHSLFEEFVENFEIALKENNLIGQTTKAVNVMTIHKSKGLEFGATIVALKPNKNHSNNLLVIENKNVVEALGFFSKKELFFSDFLRNQFNKLEKSEQIDELNLLYVAFTRAKQALVVLSNDDYKPFDFVKETVLKNSNFYQDGELTKKIFNLAKSDYKFCFIEASKLPEQRVETQLVVQDFVSQTKGIAFHKLIEIIDTFSIEQIKEKMPVIRENFEFFLTDEELNEIEKLAISFVKSDFIQDLNGKNYLKEQSVVYNNEIFRFDLIVFDDIVKIIDYKFSSLKQGSHIKQVKNYCQIAKEIYRKASKGYLIYVCKDGIFTEIVL